jgi:glycyl-tRNA synthetase beta chain
MLNSDDGAVLMQIYRRVSNILGEEQIIAKIDESKFIVDAEKDLYAEIKYIMPKIEASVLSKDFASSMSHLCFLRSKINSFFDDVMVNDPDISVANNRKSILKLIADIFGKIAHFERLL